MWNFMPAAELQFFRQIDALFCSYIDMSFHTANDFLYIISDNSTPSKQYKLFIKFKCTRYN